MNAIEILLRDENGDVRDDIDFSWEIKDFTSENIQLQFYFENAEQLSQGFEANDQMHVTFWDT